VSLWIKRDVLLPRNRKTYQLAELLAQSGADLFGGRDELAWRAIAMAILEQLWAHVLEHYPSGDVTDAPAAELRDALAPWLIGTPWAVQDVRELLKKSGHMCVTRRGRVVVRDWLEWTGAEAVRLHNDRKRKRLERSRRNGRVRSHSHGRSKGQTALAEKSREEKRRDIEPTPKSKALVARSATAKLSVPVIVQRLQDVEQTTVRRENADTRRDVFVEIVFAYWAKRLGHEKVLLDRKRQGTLRARLVENGDDVSELLYVVDGALRDDWTMGRDPRSTKKFDGIETIYQDRAHVEKFAGGCAAFKRGEIHPMADKYAAAAPAV